MKTWKFKVFINLGERNIKKYNVDCQVSDDEYIVLEIAYKNEFDFDTLDDLLNVLITYDLKEYDKYEINLSKCNITIEDIKKINFKELNPRDLEMKSMDTAEKELTPLLINELGEENKNKIDNAKLLVCIF